MIHFQAKTSWYISQLAIQRHSHMTCPLSKSSETSKWNSSLYRLPFKAWNGRESNGCLPLVPGNPISKKSEKPILPNHTEMYNILLMYSWSKFKNGCWYFFNTIIQLRQLTPSRLPSHFWVASFCLWPAGHLHSYEPTVLMQFPPWHIPGIAWHSSTSAKRIVWLKITLSIFENKLQLIISPGIHRGYSSWWQPKNGRSTVRFKNICT